MPSHRSALIALAALAGLTLSGCSREYSFRNLTTDSVVDALLANVTTRPANVAAERGRA